MAELSIIVPIYNVEKYLPRCLDSILQQTYKDFELILINDGSPDNCAKIIEQYAQRDNRIITIQQENKGVSAARNAGLKIASGKYVGFVDPDDYIDKRFFKILISQLEITNSDIACCNWDSFFENGEVRSHEVKNMPEYMQQIELVNHIFDSPRTLGGSNCNKMFLREKINELYDEHMTICEDNLFLVSYCQNIKKACYANEALYHIFERPDSASRKDIKKIVYGLSARKRLIIIARKIDKECGMYAEKDYLDSCYLYFKQFENEIDQSYSVESKRLLKKYIKSNFFRVMLNSKIYWKTKLLYFKEVYL